MRPNFIFLQAEDTGRHLGCYDCPAARTPNLNALAERGIRFDQAWSTCPVCAPSRCSTVTGQYPWTIGSHHMRSTLAESPVTYSEVLRDHGYHVNWFTKTDFNFTPREEFADDTSDWLEDLRNGTLPADKPFFLYQNFTVTHESTMWIGADSDAKIQWGAFLKRLNGRHLLGEEGRHRPEDMPVPSYLADCPEVRADIARYFDALKIQDAQIGAVLDALAESPYADNTIIIYLSDHGRGLVREKRLCYAAGLHMPMIMAGPGINPGQVSDQVVSWVDIAPTILNLAGIDIPDQYQGHDIFSGERKHAFGGRGRMDECYDSIRSVTDGEYLFIHNDHPEIPYAPNHIYEQRQLTTKTMRELHVYGELEWPATAWLQPTKPPEELYHLASDPDCVNNLIDQEDRADRAASLRQALADHRTDSADLGLLPEREIINRGILVDELATVYNPRRKPINEVFYPPAKGFPAMEMPGHQEIEPLS